MFNSNMNGLVWVLGVQYVSRVIPISKMQKKNVAPGRILLTEETSPVARVPADRGRRRVFGRSIEHAVYGAARHTIGF